MKQRHSQANRNRIHQPQTTLRKYFSWKENDPRRMHRDAGRSEKNTESKHGST